MGTNKSSQSTFKRAIVLALLGSIYVAGVVEGQLSSNQFTNSAIRKKIIDGHNQYRRSTKFPANAMRELKWDNYLAQEAENLARTCVFAHRTNGYGQNLYASSESYRNIGSSYAPVFQDAWADERHADHARIGNIAVGRQVGVGVYDHYSAMVWDSTTKVGCAYATGCSGWNTIVVPM